MAVEKTFSFLRDKAQAFKVFHIVFSIIILIASLKTVVDAMGASNTALLALAGAEVIAVILFVFPKFTKNAGIALIVIFLIAIAFSFVAGIVMSQLHLIVYLVCTYYIVIHGNAWSKST